MWDLGGVGFPGFGALGVSVWVNSTGLTVLGLGLGFGLFGRMFIPDRGTHMVAP